MDLDAGTLGSIKNIALFVAGIIGFLALSYMAAKGIFKLTNEEDEEQNSNPHITQEDEAYKRICK